MGEIRCTLKQVQDGVAVPFDETTTIVVMPAVAQMTLTGRSFDSGRTFLLPQTQNALNEVFAFATRMQAKHAVVVGHVEDVDPEHEALSEARATIISIVEASILLQGNAPQRSPDAIYTLAISPIHAQPEELPLGVFIRAPRFARAAYTSNGPKGEGDYHPRATPPEPYG